MIQFNKNAFGLAPASQNIPVPSITPNASSRASLPVSQNASMLSPAAATATLQVGLCCSLARILDPGSLSNDSAEGTGHGSRRLRLFEEMVCNPVTEVIQLQAGQLSPSSPEAGLKWTAAVNLAHSQAYILKLKHERLPCEALKIEEIYKSCQACC